MGSVLFVHGTGVREPSYTNTFKIIAEAISNNLQGWDPVRCYWGEPYGVKLRQNWDSIPSYTNRSIEDVESSEDEEVALWEILYQDPLYEIRLLMATTAEPAEELAPGETPPWEGLQEQIGQFHPSQKLSELLEQSGLVEILQQAFREISDSAVFLDAIRQASTDENATIDIIARAVTARMIVLSEETGAPSINGKTRDEIVGYLVTELSGDSRSIDGSSRSISGWVVNPLKGMALRLMTRRIERKRGVISDASAPVAGDILLYQTKGSEIRTFIRDQIAKLSDPVIIIAHSLGGIACVDLLILEKHTNVRGLITVGSQSPLFYELDCLTSANYGDKLPDHFPRWLNIYDPRDFLGYIGAKVFHGKVEDFEVRSRQPFPQSHSAYWTIPELWKKVAEFVK